MKYSIVIPCYNESENLFDMVEKLKCFKNYKETEFVLVENGSQDDSREIFEKKLKLDKKHFKKVYVKKNLGYGYGLQQGLKKASGSYVGWLHADLQVSPNELDKLIEYLESQNFEGCFFLKGNRKNRSLFDCFFTFCMTIYEFFVFHKKMNDIGAIPVLFNRELMNNFKNIPNDFSIELYAYYIAKCNNYQIKRFPVVLNKRLKGKSSWNKGFKSKIRQSKIIMKDSLKIKKGEKIL